MAAVEPKGRARAANFIARGADQFSAILLLTGQITVGGVFFSPGAFSLSLSGPFTGFGAVGADEAASFVLDGIDVITAFLLIIGQIQVMGAYITAGRFTIVVSGPPFGAGRIEGYTPRAMDFFSDFRLNVANRFGV